MSTPTGADCRHTQRQVGQHASELIDWRVAIGAAAAPAALMLTFLLRLPESPRWLVKSDRRDEAAAVLERIRPDTYDIDAEIGEMTDLAEQEQRARTRGWPGLRADWVRPALVTGCGIAIFT
jgi:hypothetical protein